MAILITLLCLKFQAPAWYPKRVNLVFYGAFSRVLAEYPVYVHSEIVGIGKIL